METMLAHVIYFKWGFCVPHTCSIHDIAKYVGVLLKNTSIIVYFNENDCYSEKKENKFTNLDIGAM